MNKLVLITLFLILLYGCRTPSNLTNHWAYIDPMGGGARLHISTGSSFDYSMYYGLAFYHTNGNWRLKEATLLLINDHIYPSPAIVHSQLVPNKDSIYISVQDTRNETVPFASVVTWRGQDTLVNTDTDIDGKLTLPFSRIDSFSIAFSFYLPCHHKTTNIEHNHYTFILQDRIMADYLYFDTLKYVKKRRHLQGESYRLEAEE